MLEYQISIQSPNNNDWYDNDIGCDYGTKKCIVFMPQLKLTPYFYNDGDLILARVVARNSAGWGKPSDVNEIGAVLPYALPPMFPPIITDRSTYTVTLSWNAINDRNYQVEEIVYEVWWSSGYDFEMLTETVRTEFVVNIPSHTFEY